jgi:hypothetical protein
MTHTHSDSDSKEEYSTFLLQFDAVLVTLSVTAILTGGLRLLQLALSAEEMSMYLWADPHHPLQWFVWYLGLSISFIAWIPFGLAVGLVDLLVWRRMVRRGKVGLWEPLLLFVISVFFSVNWVRHLLQGDRLSVSWPLVPVLLLGAAGGLVAKRVFVRWQIARRRTTVT